MTAKGRKKHWTDGLSIDYMIFLAGILSIGIVFYAGIQWFYNKIIKWW